MSALQAGSRVEGVELTVQGLEGFGGKLSVGFWVLSLALHPTLHNYV